MQRGFYKDRIVCAGTFKKVELYVQGLLERQNCMCRDFQKGRLVCAGTFRKVELYVQGLLVRQMCMCRDFQKGRSVCAGTFRKVELYVQGLLERQNCMCRDFQKVYCWRALIFIGIKEKQGMYRWIKLLLFRRGYGGGRVPPSPPWAFQGVRAFMQQ